MTMNNLGKWITNGKQTPFYARREFRLEKPVRSAEARVCGLGQFNFYMNGRKVEDHELDPGWTNYNKVIQYVTFDITDYVVQGENAAGAEVGNGWYIKADEHYTFKFPEFMPPNPNPYRPFGEELVLALWIKAEYTDGTVDIFTAEDGFRILDHPVVMSNVYGSETIDGRLAQSGWCEAGFDDSAWDTALIVAKENEPKGIMEEQKQPPIKVIHTYQAQRLKDFENREIYDFSQNMSGILEFEVKGKRGDQICIYPAEKLTSDGDVDQMAKGWVNLDSCITYIIGQDDVWETCRMRFTYFAGRFAAVEKSDSKMELRNLRADAISSAWKTDGAFACDDRRYEQIYSLVEKAVEANMVSVHTDCPTIERFAWQEPNHLMAPSIMYMKDGSRLWEKFLKDMRTDQHTADDFFYDFAGNKYYPGEGLMPSQCPCYIPNVLPVPGMGSFYDIIPWGSTCILGTYWHYVFYGNVKIIEENYDAGMRYLEHLKTKLNEDGFINHGLGDWGNPENTLVRENIETAFLYADTITLKKFAGILGKEQDAEELNAFAEKVKENYNEKLLVWDENRGLWCYRAWDHPDEIFMTQASQALPLYWGMVPQGKEADIVRAFRQTLDEKQAFVAGEIGLPYVIQTARRYGMNDLICRFILRETHPSYYAFVLDGETTLGEYWETNPRSHCHDMMGHIVEWYYNGIAGIQPEEPGFGKVKICPYLPESMHEFTCSYESASGLIKVSVKEQEQEIILHVETPEKMQVTVDTLNLAVGDKNVRVERGQSGNQ